MESSTSFAPAVVAPTFNNGRTLAGVLDRIGAASLPVFVVDDGSTDATPRILSDRAAGRLARVLTHPRNRGKAAAMRTGFAAAREAGHTHAVTIDTDGQLDPEQIPDFVAAARAAPAALVIGNRDDRAADYPARSRVGRRLSNLFIRMESGVRVEDSQCGFRVYPLGLVEAVRPRAGRYGYESEIITRAGWAGCAIVHVPVRCRYLPGDERVSHFRPWVDSIRMIGLHARLMLRALLPWPHPKWPPTPAPPADRRPLWRRVLQWISPVEAWRQLRRDRVGRTQLAAGLAVGAFIANLPLYPVQTLASVYVAKRLHLHPLAVVLGSQLSTPPVGPILIVAGICLGHAVLHGSWPSPSQFNVMGLGWSGWERLFRTVFVEWAVGGAMIGLAAAVLTFVTANLLFRVFSRDGADESPAAADDAAAQSA